MPVIGTLVPSDSQSSSWHDHGPIATTTLSHCTTSPVASVTLVALPAPSTLMPVTPAPTLSVAPAATAAAIIFVVSSKGVTCAVSVSMLLEVHAPSSQLGCVAPFLRLSTCNVGSFLYDSIPSVLDSSSCIWKEMVCRGSVGPSPPVGGRGGGGGCESEKSTHSRTCRAVHMCVHACARDGAEELGRCAGRSLATAVGPTSSQRMPPNPLDADAR